MHTAFRPSATCAFLKDGGAVPLIEVGTASWRDLMSGAPQSAGGRLVAGGEGWLTALYDLIEDARAWERHPAGDEILFVVTGEMAIVLEAESGEERIVVRAGEAFLLPRGTWHRVVNAAGRISPRSSEDPADVLQRLRLESEGVRFDRSGGIRLARFQWRPRGQGPPRLESRP